VQYNERNYMRDYKFDEGRGGAKMGHLLWRTYPSDGEDDWNSLYGETIYDPISMKMHKTYS